MSNSDRNLKVKDIKYVVDSFVKALPYFLSQEGARVVLTRFGSFYVKLLKSRTGINPNTKKSMVIGEKLRIRFKESNSR